MKRMVTGLICGICLMMTACAAQIGVSEEFDRSVKTFNRLVRWHEIESAGMTYLGQEQQEEFMKQAEALKKRGLTITDYRILFTRYLPEKHAGDVVAEFDYYILPSNKIKTVSYRQEWLYQESTKSWKLASRLPTFE